MQIGGTKYPVHPIGPQDASQFWLNLQKAAGKLGSSLESIGITYDEFLNNASGTTNRRLFIVAMDLEKVLEAGYSGADLGSGKAMLFDFKHVGTGTESTQAKRVHCLMVHEAAISISEAGGQVSS